MRIRSSMMHFRAVMAAGLSLLSASLVRADNLSVIFAPAFMTVAPGGTVTFSGAITNTSSFTIFVSGDSFTGMDADLNIDDTAFATDTPFSLAPGQSYPLLGNISFFDATLSPGAVLGGDYTGIFNVLGGLVNGAQDIQGNHTFTVEAAAVPETSTLASFGVLLIGTGILAFKTRQRFCPS